jgi:hypothetical protein
VKRSAPRRHVDATAVAQRAVLATVLAIAATASYIHLREVWEAAAAPIPTFSPLLVDGLFAAAWLRIRERRVAGVAVGWLAWAALLLALAATVAGNVSAAWISGHRDPLSLIVATWPAIAFALVWELVTGHGRKPRHSSANTATPPGGVGGPPPDPAETPDQVLDRLVLEGATQKEMATALGVSRWRVRELLAARGGSATDGADGAEGSA